MLKLHEGFLGLVSMMLAAPQLFAASAVDVPVIDMRDATTEEAREKALRMSENGVAILYLSANDVPERAVQAVAGGCAEGGFQVRALILAQPGDAAEGMVLYGAVGGPLGPTIPVSSNMKAMAKAQADSLKDRLERSPAGMAAVDPLDVVRCRYIPVVGSLVRKEKVCTTPRQDAEARESDKSWTKRVQDRGANEAKPGS